jgi:PAS domain-containing protein
MTLLDLQTVALLLVVGFLVALTALGVIGLGPAQATGGVSPPESSDPYFVFDRRLLVHANRAALVLIGAPVAHGQEWAALVAALDAEFAGARAALKRLAEDGTAFRLPGGPSGALTGRASNGRLRILVIRNPEPERADDAAHLRAVVAAMPCLAWTETEDGKVTWANPAYREVADRRGTVETPLFRDMAKGVRPGSSVRCLLEGRDGAQPAWFDLHPGLPGQGAQMNFAVPADAVVKAETALRQFVQALTQIFAHLPIGLAVFDRERRLAMFNPALTDLTGLAPDYLSGRPDLRAVLDRLREARMLPEPRNYASWREALLGMERAATSGTYEDNWDLPDGRTFRVTGRPHPDGALAFLFEDITPALTLQRQFRAEIELGQSLIDSTTDAIAVFTSQGDLSMTNAAFAEIFGFDPAEHVVPLSIKDFVAQMRPRTRADDLWDAFLALARTSQNRAAVEGLLRLNSGRIVEARFLPLSHGATMCRFQTREVPALPQRRAISA